MRTISEVAPAWVNSAALLPARMGCTSMVTPRIASRASMSTTRSTTTVASTMVFEQCSRRASAHARTNSPSRKGSTLLAMKPIMVAL